MSSATDEVFVSALPRMGVAARIEKGEHLMSKLIILRGNSGSGKTSAAKMLQDKLGPNTMRISSDMIRMEILHV